jgi:hypothetical protein
MTRSPSMPRGLAPSRLILPAVQESPIQERVSSLLEPSTAEIRRAKRAMVPRLEDGRAHRVPALLLAAAADLGAEPWIEPLELTFHAAPEPDAISPDDPTLVYIRSRLAGVRGLAELTVAGVVCRPSTRRTTRSGTTGLQHVRSGSRSGSATRAADLVCTCRRTARRSRRRT